MRGLACRLVGREIGDGSYGRYNNIPGFDIDPPPAPKPSRMPAKPTTTMQSFPNPAPGRDYLIRMEIPEFTCLCPMTGQPDFATLHLDYIADRKCVELKSLKLYIWSYRDQGAYHEAVTNRILEDLVRLLAPRFMRLTAKFYVRGGIFTTVVAEHRKKGWRPASPVELPAFAPQPSTR